MIPTALLLVLIFCLLGILHIYWAFGGQWAIAGALPTKTDGSKALQPTPQACLVVACLLLLVALCYLNDLFAVIPLPAQLARIILGLVPLLLLLRTIGDFRYVGLFKKIKKGTFARKDTYIYVPLCAGISLLGFLYLVLHS
jgi:hypothetical protein